MALHHVMPQCDRTTCLLLGVLELGLTAFAWALVTPFIGPTFQGLPPDERIKALAFVVCGPLSALPAAVTMLWHRRLGAAWLVGGGSLSGLMAVSWFATDRGLLLAALPMPMVGVGLWQLLTQSESASVEHATRTGRVVSLVLGATFFLVGWVGTYALIVVLILNNVTGFRAEPVPGTFGVVENRNLADSLVVLLVGAVVAILTLVRKPLRIRWTFLAGQWVAVLLAGLVIMTG